MHRVMCFVGFHHWEHHVNHQMGGPNARYDLCSHCGQERPSSVADRWLPTYTGRGGRDA